jgi:hypothetical protein
MEKLISNCGLICTDCGAYIATQKNDNTLRKEVAEKWTKEYKHDFKIEDINCDGCKSSGRHVGYCMVCQIRSCAQGKSVENCAWCADYPCGKLDEFFKISPNNKATLDGIKKEIHWFKGYLRGAQSLLPNNPAPRDKAEGEDIEKTDNESLLARIRALEENNLKLAKELASLDISTTLAWHTGGAGFLGESKLFDAYISEKLKKSREQIEQATSIAEPLKISRQFEKDCLAFYNALSNKE